MPVGCCFALLDRLRSFSYLKQGLSPWISRLGIGDHGLEGQGWHHGGKVGVLVLQYGRQKSPSEEGEAWRGLCVRFSSLVLGYRFEVSEEWGFVKGGCG